MHFGLLYTPLKTENGPFRKVFPGWRYSESSFVVFEGQKIRLLEMIMLRCMFIRVCIREMCNWDMCYDFGVFEYV